MAFYPLCGKAVQVIKEPINANKSALADFIKEYDRFRSSILLSHIREATYKISIANTHPFTREVNGREYAFAHNGVLHKYQNKFSTKGYKPIGATDSEYALCHLLNVMVGASAVRDRTIFPQLEKEMGKINEYGTFNCLFIDGEHLFCYRDKTEHKNICYTKRKPPYDKTIKLIGKHIEYNPNIKKKKGELGVVVIRCL